jgi:hypothetical protein
MEMQIGLMTIDERMDMAEPPCWSDRVPDGLTPHAGAAFTPTSREGGQFLLSPSARPMAYDEPSELS